MDAHLEESLGEAPEAPADFRGGLIAAAVGALGAGPLGPEAWEPRPGLEPDAEDWGPPSGDGAEAASVAPSPPLAPALGASAGAWEVRPAHGGAPTQAGAAELDESPAFGDLPEALAPFRVAPAAPQPAEALPGGGLADGPPRGGAAAASGEAVAPAAAPASEGPAWWAGEAAPEWAPEGLEPEAPPPPAELDPIALTLAPLFHQGYVPRRSAPRLMDPQVRQEAERRLNAVGLSLAWSPYSRHVGLSLAEGTSGGRERITNLRELDRNALALLVILWARLVLPQRLAAEGREGGVSDPVVSFDALNAEFGKKLGGRRFEMYLAQLKRLGFLEYTRKDELRAGPFLDLLGDAQALASYLRQSALAHLLRGVEGQEAVEAIAEEEAEGEDEAPEGVGEAVAEQAQAQELRLARGVAR